jgi:hypothetical protein
LLFPSAAGGGGGGGSGYVSSSSAVSEDSSAIAGRTVGGVDNTPAFTGLAEYINSERQGATSGKACAVKVVLWYSTIPLKFVEMVLLLLRYDGNLVTGDGEMDATPFVRSNKDLVVLRKLSSTLLFVAPLWP